MNAERAAADNEEAFCDVFELLLELHKVGGYAPLDIDKLTRDTYAVLTHGMTFIARDEKGTPIGILGLVEEPFYYSQVTFLGSKWLYVRPEHRGGPAFRALLHAAKAEAEARDKLLFIQIDNPDRRPKSTRTTIEAQGAGFVPLGYTLRIR